MVYENIEVTAVGFAPSKEEIKKYVEHIVQERNCKVSDIDKMKLTLESEDSVTMEYTLKERRFERIRRITGYLVGTVDRWNNAKQEELSDRVKHA